MAGGAELDELSPQGRRPTMRRMSEQTRSRRQHLRRGLPKRRRRSPRPPEIPYGIVGTISEVRYVL